MQKLWVLSGRIAYWLSWPLLFLYLQRSERTRVLVVCGDEVLVVRGWLGNGRWCLPGGGIHRNELPKDGAVRELMEETGIEANATDLQFIFSRKSTQKHGPGFKMHIYALTLANKPKLLKQKLEITHILWMKKRDLLDSPQVEDDAKDIVTAMR